MQHVLRYPALDWRVLQEFRTVDVFDIVCPAVLWFL